MHIDSKSTTASSYAPMQQQHLQTENSALMLIQPGLRATIIKYKSGTFLSGF
jgi:hypothetical protein